MDPAPWSLAVRASDHELKDRLAAQLAAWHASGFLIERATAWKLPDSPYLAAMRAYYINK
jgi:ABC-type amino acid transport substrate-binding protein